MLATETKTTPKSGPAFGLTTAQPTFSQPAGTVYVRRTPSTVLVPGVRPEVAGVDPSDDGASVAGGVAVAKLCSGVPATLSSSESPDEHAAIGIIAIVAMAALTMRCRLGLAFAVEGLGSTFTRMLPGRGGERDLLTGWAHRERCRSEIRRTSLRWLAHPIWMESRITSRSARSCADVSGNDHTTITRRVPSTSRIHIRFCWLGANAHWFGRLPLPRTSLSVLPQGVTALCALVRVVVGNGELELRPFEPP